MGGSCRRAQGSPTLGRALLVGPGNRCVDKKERESLWPLETISPTSLLSLPTVRGGWGGGGGTVEDKGANYSVSGLID